MGMRKRIMKGMQPKKASRAPIAALHRTKAATGRATGRATAWAEGQLGRRRRRSSSHTGLIGLGAAVLALPVGVMLGRHFGRSEHTSADTTI